MTATASTTPVRDVSTTESLLWEVSQLKAALAAHMGDRSVETPDETPETDVPQPLDRLTDALGLSPFERQVLVLAAAVELDGEVASMVAEITGALRPTFSLALNVLPSPHWDAMTPDSSLRYWRLIELDNGSLLADTPMRIDERILHYLVGLSAFDQRLEGIAERMETTQRLAPSQREVANELTDTLRELDRPSLVTLTGDDIPAMGAVAHNIVESLGGHPVTINVSALPSAGPGLLELVRVFDRETALSGVLPILSNVEAHVEAGLAFTSLSSAPVVFEIGAVSSATALPAPRVRLRRTVDRPPPPEQRLLWLQSLDDAESEPLNAAIDEVSHEHRLDTATLHSISQELNAAPHDPEGTPGRLRALCRERTRLDLHGLAQRITPMATWDDIVLPPSHLTLLREIGKHVRHRTKVYEEWGFATKTSRGLGVTALFAGESGTGKTMAAEVLANDLGLDLYRIDLAATVSKYIGETEKNLGRLFDAAEASGAILLFDEADALFGKRGEVKDSHDRYANMEVSYLLQRMESYRGLAILTTNLRSNLDQAFVRRLRFIVQFPFPDSEHRAHIWKRVFPADTPLAGVEPGRLAQMSISGGSIWSIAVAAAFQAADADSVVSPSHILQAAQVEYAKSDRVLTDSETQGWS
jgi:hypothetical protein